MGRWGGGGEGGHMGRWEEGASIPSCASLVLFCSHGGCRGHKLLKRNLFAKLKIFAAICFDLYTIGVVYILGNDKFLN